MVSQQPQNFVPEPALESGDRLRGSSHLCSYQIYHRSFDEAHTDIAIVREAVFQKEQGVDPALDWDGLDEQCAHLIAYSAQAPIGVARLRALAPPIATPTQAAIVKLERVAVLKPLRGQGIGRVLVQVAIGFAQTQKMKTVVLHAQLPTVPFYEALGFTICGEPFTEAGIAHIKMAKKLQSD